MLQDGLVKYQGHLFQLLFGFLNLIIFYPFADLWYNTCKILAMNFQSFFKSNFLSSGSNLINKQVSPIDYLSPIGVQNRQSSRICASLADLLSIFQFWDNCLDSDILTFRRVISAPIISDDLLVGIFFHLIVIFVANRNFVLIC